MSDQPISASDIRRAKAQQNWEKSQKPRVTTDEVMRVIVEFLNTGDQEVLLPAKYSDKEQTFRKVIRDKANTMFHGLVWTLKDDDGLYLTSF